MKILFPWTKAKIKQKISKETLLKTGQKADSIEMFPQKKGTVLCYIVLEDGTVAQTTIQLPI